MNLMDNGSIDIGELRFVKTGDKLGMSPVSVSRNNFPLRSIVLLLMLPPSGVRWYSSRDNVTSDDLVPTHETLSLILCANDFFL
uniref:Heparanase 1 n=1 Tax=Solanum tuberosum TaxID=4113 RepID=M1CAK6_SOLTU